MISQSFDYNTVVSLCHRLIKLFEVDLVYNKVEELNKEDDVWLYNVLHYIVVDSIS